MLSNPEYLMALLVLSGALVIILLALNLFIKLRRIKDLNKTVAQLKRSVEEMDEQSKLLVRTDLELNKIQEELDKRIKGLYALQRISQDLSRTLDQDEIFRRLSRERISEIGFQKAMVFTQTKNPRARLKHQVGFDEEELPRLEDEFARERFPDVIRQKNSAFSSLAQEPALRKIITGIIKVTRLDSFVVSPLTRKEGFCGFILLGNLGNETQISEGDEELVAILATHVGQALENAELFETTYSQHQELEKKVIARTQELNQTLNELKAVSKRKTDFVSAVSHELRTPLTSIKGYASILLSEKLGKLPPELKERLDKINKHSDELTHLINDLLDIARLESGRVEMKLEPLDIAHIATAAVDLLNPQLKEKAVSVQMNIPQGLSRALADRSQISRVFINLFGNAIKFVTPGTGAIKVSAFESAEALQVNVSDNGIGMSQNDSEHIFDEFYRVDNVINQKVKGTGLGLTLVKNIIQAHQGKIWVESRLNQGATFSFTLPKSP